MPRFYVKVFLNGFIGCYGLKLLLSALYFYLILFTQYTSKRDLFSKFLDVNRGRLMFGVRAMVVS